MASAIPTTMRALAIQKYTKPSGYKILELPVPEIKNPKDIVVKVHAASINPIDVKLANGIAKMLRKETFPYQLGMDLAGTVVSVGPSVTKFKPGDEIYTKAPEAYHGAVAEYALADADTTVLKPQSLNFVDAASIPLVGQTSLESFRLAETLVEGGLKGKTVLVPGALSGTGLVAIQLAKIFGAAKIITTLSPGKLARAKEFFGEEGIEYVDYTTGNVVAQIGTGTVDFLYDTMGVGPTYLPVVKKGGAVVSITALPSGDYAAKNFPEVPMLIRWALTAMDAWNRRKYRAAGVGFRYVILQPTLQMMEDLDRWVGEGKLKTLVGKTAKLGDLEEVKKGCQAILDGKGGVGKFVIEID